MFGIAQLQRGFDHRGHGRSGGRRGDIAQPDSLLADLGDLAFHRLGDGARAVADLLGGLAEVQRIRDGQEVPELSQIHRRKGYHRTANPVDRKSVV